MHNVIICQHCAMCSSRNIHNPPWKVISNSKGGVFQRVWRSMIDYYSGNSRWQCGGRGCRQISFHGRGMDIFLNYKIIITFQHKKIIIGAYKFVNVIFRLLLAYLFIPLLQHELDVFKETIWNTPRIRKQDTLLPNGVTEHVYSFPQEYGLEECGR